MIIGFVFLLFWGGSLPATGDIGRQIEAPVSQSITMLKQTQQKEEQWRQEKEKQVARFEQLQQQQAKMRSRVAHLRQQIEAARTRVDAKEQQLTDIDTI